MIALRSLDQKGNIRVSSGVSEPRPESLNGRRVSLWTQKAISGLAIPTMIGSKSLTRKRNGYVRWEMKAKVTANSKNHDRSLSMQKATCGSPTMGITGYRSLAKMVNISVSLTLLVKPTSEKADWNTPDRVRTPSRLGHTTTCGSALTLEARYRSSESEATLSRNSGHMVNVM